MRTHAWREGAGPCALMHVGRGGGGQGHAHSCMGGGGRAMHTHAWGWVNTCMGVGKSAVTPGSPCCSLLSSLAPLLQPAVTLAPHATACCQAWPPLLQPTVTLAPPATACCHTAPPCYSLPSSLAPLLHMHAWLSPLQLGQHAPPPQVRAVHTPMHQARAHPHAHSHARVHQRSPTCSGLLRGRVKVTTKKFLTPAGVECGG